jgi:hypothetical protein
MAYGDNNSELRSISFGAPLGSNFPGNVPMIYHYQSNDSLATITGNGYFDGVLNDDLKAGDVIITNYDMDGTPGLAILLVTSGGSDVSVTKHDVS